MVVTMLRHGHCHACLGRRDGRDHAWVSGIRLRDVASGHRLSSMVGNTKRVYGHMVRATVGKSHREEKGKAVDPDVTLRELRGAIHTFKSLPESATEARMAAAEDIIEFAEALDEWLAKGGHLPYAWARESAE